MQDPRTIGFQPDCPPDDIEAKRADEVSAYADELERRDPAAIWQALDRFQCAQGAMAEQLVAAVLFGWVRDLPEAQSKLQKAMRPYMERVAEDELERIAQMMNVPDDEEAF